MAPPKVKAGAPLEVLDYYAYLAGVLIDPSAIVYRIEPAAGGPPVLDEDGVSVSGITPIRVQEGLYHAGKTVLPPSLAAGDYVIFWDVTKLATSPASIERAVTFELVGELAVDPEQEGQSRRDIPDEPNVDALRVLVKDNAPDDTAWAFFNSELKTILDNAVVQHTAGDRTLATATPDDIAMSMMLAQCDVLTALATDTSKFFRWTDGNESVDKTTTPQSLANNCRAIMAKYDSLMDRRLKKVEDGRSGPRGRDLMKWRARRRGRGR